MAPLCDQTNSPRGLGGQLEQLYTVSSQGKQVPRGASSKTTSILFTCLSAQSPHHLHNMHSQRQTKTSRPQGVKLHWGRLQQGLSTAATRSLAGANPSEGEDIDSQ